jgi:hypothetical protein
MQMERTGGGFYPPFLKGGGGDFRYKPAAEIPPSPPFSKGGFSAILRLNNNNDPDAVWFFTPTLTLKLIREGL